MNILLFLKQNGFHEFIEELFLRLKLWDMNDADLKSLSQNSSFIDNNEYLSVVKLASEDDEIFNRFRANRQYRKILEHVTKNWEINT